MIPPAPEMTPATIVFGTVESHVNRSTLPLRSIGPLRSSLPRALVLVSTVAVAAPNLSGLVRASVFWLLPVALLVIAAPPLIVRLPLPASV